MADDAAARPADDGVAQPTERLASDQSSMNENAPQPEPLAADYIEYEEAMEIVDVSAPALLRFVDDGSIRAFQHEGRMKFLRQELARFREDLEETYIANKRNLEQQVIVTCPHCGERQHTLRSGFSDGKTLCAGCEARFPVPPSPPATPLPSLLVAVRSRPGTKTPQGETAPGGDSRSVVAGEGSASHRYVLIEKLGHGAMGVVWKAQDQQLNRIVALKQILHGEDEPEVVERFIREARLASRLNHPNIASVFDAGMLDGHPYFTMELIEGESLDRVIAAQRAFNKRRGESSANHPTEVSTQSDGQDASRDPLPPERVINIARQVAYALACAHEQGIIHRDVKPSNIMLDGRARLTDFGLACALGASRLTGAGQVLGTPTYMAPEQVRGKPPTPAVDVYALGAVIFEMWTGAPPFDGDTPIAVAMKHVLEPAPNRPEVWARGLEELGQMVARCLSKEPEARPTSVELMVSLERLLDQYQALRRAGEPLQEFCPEASIPRTAGEPRLEPVWGVVVVAKLTGFPPNATADYQWDDGALLAEYYRRMRPAVDTWGGAIVQLDGEVVTAVFFARNRQKAVKAALSAAAGMMNMFHHFAEFPKGLKWIHPTSETDEGANAAVERPIPNAESYTPPDLKIGVSMHAGDLRAGPVHDGETYRFVAFGEAMDLARRLGKYCPPQSEYRPYAIVATDPIVELLSSDWRSVRTRRVTLADGRSLLIHDLDDVGWIEMRKRLPDQSPDDHSISS